MTSKLVKLDQKKLTTTIKEFVLDQRLIFEFFDKQPEKGRDKLVVKAFLLGVLALQEDRLSAFLAKTANTLGTELESLKYIFDLNQELFFKTTGKGREVEADLVEVLEQYLKVRRYRDEVSHKGEVAGDLKGNKTGDILVKVNKSEDLKIVIESKFDKSKRLGLIQDIDAYVKNDTAVGQLLEASVNRSAQQGIIVFDREIIDAKLDAEVENVKYVPQVGFVCIVDHQRGDYGNLFLSYDLARDMCIHPRAEETASILSILVGRFLHDVNLFLSLKKKLIELRSGTDSMIKTIHKAILSLEFSKQVLSTFLENGSLEKKTLFELYHADTVKKQYKDIEKEIEDLFETI